MRTLLIPGIAAVVAACTGPVPVPSSSAAAPVQPELRTAPPVTPVPTAAAPTFAFAIDCGPMDPVACEDRVASLMATEDPALVQRITILDEKGSYTMTWTNGQSVTGIFD